MSAGRPPVIAVKAVQQHAAWYWELRASGNGKVIADSRCTYPTKAGAIRAANRMKEIVFHAEVRT